MRMRPAFYLKHLLSRPGIADSCVLALLLLAHPIVYLFNSSLGAFYPDTGLYFRFARDVLPQGLLYVGADDASSGAILPPLYPFLLTIGQTFTGDLLRLSEWTNSILIILVSVPLYYLLRDRVGRGSALVVLLLVQLNHFLVVWAFLPLTEASFLLASSLTLLLLSRWHPRRATVHAVLIGSLCALVFFARQIGIVALPFAILYLMSFGVRKTTKPVAMALIGFAVLAGPYAFLLQEQTGHGPLTQKFSNASTRTNADPAVVERVEAIHRLPAKKYEDFLVKRRMLRELTPDSSAMLQSIQVESRAQVSNRTQVEQALATLLRSPSAYLRRLLNNLEFLHLSLGRVGSIALLVAFLSPLAVRIDAITLRQRYLIPAFAVFYVLALSLVSGAIDRYLFVLVPLALVHVGGEIALVVRSSKTSLSRSVQHVSLLLVMLAISLTQPQKLNPQEFRPKVPELQWPQAAFRQFITPGAPVMTIHPRHAYFAGGEFRILPNDRLEKIAAYAKKTGVEWLLLSRSPRDRAEIELYSNSKWYLDPQIHVNYRHLLTAQATTAGGAFILLRFN